MHCTVSIRSFGSFCTALFAAVAAFGSTVKSLASPGSSRLALTRTERGVSRLVSALPEQAQNLAQFVAFPLRSSAAGLIIVRPFLNEIQSEGTVSPARVDGPFAASVRRRMSSLAQAFSEYTPARKLSHFAARSGLGRVRSRFLPRPLGVSLPCCPPGIRVRGPPPFLKIHLIFTLRKEASLCPPRTRRDRAPKGPAVPVIRPRA